MTRANIAAFKAKTVALIDTLRLTNEEVVGLGLTLATSYGAHLPRHVLRQMLDKLVTEAKGLSETPERLRDRVLTQMAETARAAMAQGRDGWEALTLAYRETPPDVIAEAWTRATDDKTADWWSTVEMTVEASTNPTDEGRGVSK